MSGCRGVGVSGCRGVGVSGCRGVGVSGCRGVGVSGCRGVGVSGCRDVGVSECQDVGVSGCRQGRAAAQSRHGPQPALSPATAMTVPLALVTLSATSGTPDQNCGACVWWWRQAIRRLAGHEETSWEGAGRRPLGPCGGVFHRHHRALRFWATLNRPACSVAWSVRPGAWVRSKSPGDVNAGLEFVDALVHRRRSARRAVLLVKLFFTKMFGSCPCGRWC